ncbi:MAG: ROK family protein [Kineosporiaceae bacterium]
MAMRPENRHQARLLRLLRDRGATSRAELGEAVGLSRSKVAVELDRLADLGLVEGAGLADSRGGRRSHLVVLSRDLRFVGVDIGATSVDVAVTDGELRLLSRVSAPSDVRRGPRPVLDLVVELLGKLRAEGAFAELHGAGVGVPGPVSQRDGAAVVPPIMPGWDRFPIRDVLVGELGAPVMVDNDVNIMALGELHAGTARSVGDLLFVKVGTGIGCGIVVGGQVYRGVTGSAGDIGHIRVDIRGDGDGPVCACGNTGCLEAWFGGAALARDAEALARSDRSPWLAERLAAAGRLTAEDVGDAAAAGDPAASRLVRDGGRRLGHVLASLVSFANPGLVVVGGGVAGLGHPLLAEIRSVVYRRSAPLATGNLPIVLSELGDTAGVVGAARLVSDSLLGAQGAGGEEEPP